MSIDSSVRRAGFWAVDGIRGGRVRRALRDIRSTAAGEPSPSDRLARLLEHATTTTPFYEPFAGLELSAFPVTDKQEIRRREGAFRSRSFAAEPLHVKTTSGSTGAAARFLHDKGKRVQTIAEVLYFNEEAGYRPGDRLLWLRAWSAGTSRNRVQRIVQNLVPVELVGFDDTVRAEVLEVLRGGSVDCVFGVASGLWSLTRYLEHVGADPDSFGLRVVLASGDMLSVHRKARMSHAFGCPVVDRYANEENGILACTTRDNDRFELNQASYVFEFLKPDADEPQEPGQPGRVVVTDLYNMAMPLIRYDTGDIATVAPDGGRPTLLRIEGRYPDLIYDTAGREVYQAITDYLPYTHPEISQYQVVQQGPREYRVLVAPREAGTSSEEMLMLMHQLLGADAVISFEFVDSIATLGNAKQRTLIQEYAPLSRHPDGE